MIIDDLDKSDNQVIPRWMTYIQSVTADEFGRGIPQNELRSLTPAFSAELNEFYQNPTSRVGADLFERALVMGLLTETTTLAQFVAEQKNLSVTLKAVAQRIATGGVFPEPTDYFIAINRHRQLLHTNPRNPIRWAELARLYIITRNSDKAIRAIRTALQLGSSNRYVIRAALRLFIHLDDDDQLLSVGGDKLVTAPDPWVRGVGISAMLIAGKPPKRKIVPEIRNFRPESIFDHSEYLAACGMLEIHYGKMNQARLLFSGAWKDPSGNVTSHAEWATRVHFPGLRSELSSFRQPTPEALAGVAFSQGIWDRMYQAVTDWILQEPYSRKPLRFLSTIENNRGNYKAALDSIRMAEQIGPLDFNFSVSKIYALLCSGRLDAARALLSTIEISEIGSARRCILIANWGLLAFLAGETKVGMELYGRAEREGGRVNAYFRDRVFMNSIVARRMAGLTIDSEEMLRVKKIVSEHAATMDMQLLGKRILSTKKISTEKCATTLPVPDEALHDCLSDRAVDASKSGP